MADSWWRFSNTAPDHPKIVVLTDAQFRAWAILNSLASKMGGEFPEDMAIISAALRKPTGKAADLVQVMLSAKLLDRTEGGFRPHNWDERQFKSDNSTDRVRKHRERTRNDVSETFRNGQSETDQRQKQRHRQKEKIDARMARFQDFWDSCPKKQDRPAAEKAWLKAVSLVEPETIIAAMQAYAASCAGRDDEFIKTPGPWLNARRWEKHAPVSPFENTDEIGWRARLRQYRDSGGWLPKWGPAPGENGCKCPESILAEWRDAA